MNKEKQKVIPIAHSDDKMQITAVFAVTLEREYLPPQQRKTKHCHPSVITPEGWDLWHSHNHWSNEETMTRYLQNVIIPFVSHKRVHLGLPQTQAALAVFDCFKGQNTSAIEDMLEKHNIVSVIVPANCTDKLQPIDLSINKPVKDGMKACFQLWYASEIQKQLEKNAVLQEVKVDLSAPAIKAQSTNWIISVWHSIEERPELAINGFKKAGIADAIASIRV